MTTHSTTPAVGLPGTPPLPATHTEALHGPRTYEVNAQAFDDVTTELGDIAICLDMLSCITDRRGPLECDGEHHAALFRLLHRTTHRCASALEAM